MYFLKGWLMIEQLTMAAIVFLAIAIPLSILFAWLDQKFGWASKH